MADPYAAYANPVREEKTTKQKAAEANIEQSETGTARTAALTPYEVREKQLAIEKKEREAADEAAAKAAAEEAQKKAADTQRNRVRGFLQDIQRARDLLTNPLATGPAAQLTGGLYSSPGKNLTSIITALKSPVVLEAMQAARAGSKTGATGFGALSNKEMELLASNQGSLDVGQSKELLLETLNRLDTNARRVMAYNAGYDPDKPEGALLVGLAPPKGFEKAPEITEGQIKPGEWKSNPEYVGVDAAVTSMIKGGRSAGQIRQWLNEYQEGLGDRVQNIEVNVDYWRKTGKNPNVTIERQFVPEEGSAASLGTGAFGAYATGAATQLSQGFLDELSGDRERAAAVQRGLQEQNALEYGAGELTGALLSAVVPQALAAKYGLRLPALLEGLPQNVLYGIGSAEPGEGLSGGLYEGLMTPVTNVAGNIFGKAIGVPLRGADERLRRLADEYGINLTPGQLTGGGKGAEQTLSGLPIVGPQIRERRNETLEQFNRAAFDEGLAPLGVKVSAPGQKGIAEAQQAVGDAYTQALGGVTLTPDQTFVQQARGKAYSELSKLRDVGPELQREVDNIFNKYADPSGVISGDNLQAALRDLQTLKTSYKDDPRWAKRIAPQLDDISDAYSGLLERQFPENYDLFKKANEAYRNVSILENAVEYGVDGDLFNPGRLRISSRQGTTRFGGKKASARGDRPFNELVMSSLDVIPSKMDDTSLAGRLMSPSIGAGIGAGYGGVSMLAGGDEEDGRSGEEASGVLPAPIAYGLLGAGLTSLPYTRAGTRGMSYLLRGDRSPEAQRLGELVERYLPAVVRGGYRGMSAEPGVPMPQGEAPLIDPQIEALINQAQFAPAPEPTAEATEAAPQDGEVKLIGNRPARYSGAVGMWLDAETGEPVEGYANGGLVFRTGGY